jgi:uncharacterized protein with PIN domain
MNLSDLGSGKFRLPSKTKKEWNKYLVNNEWVKCPYCNSELYLFNAEEILIEDVKGSTNLNGCSNCERLWGNFT